MPDYPDDFQKMLWRLRSDPSATLRVVAGVVTVVLLLIVIFTSWFTVDPQEKGVVLRLGRISREVEPGLHFKLPFKIDRVFKVPVKNQLKQEFGFRSLQPNIRTQYASQNYDEESLMLTGDLNVADVEWVTQYRVVRPQDYLFNVRNLNQTFRDMTEAVMREVIGDHTINEVLTTGRTAVEELVKEELHARCQQYEMGIAIDQVILQDVNPPEAVKPAFNEVNQAQQEKEKLINQAQQEYNKIIPKAKGDAERAIEEAKGYGVERVNRARGEAQRFDSVYAQYRKAPEVTRQRIYLETMETVLNKVGRKIILDENATGVLPLLNLSEGAK